MIHPGGETAVVAVGMAVFQDALENGLDNVFGGEPVAGRLGQVTIERAVMAFEKLAERIKLAAAHGEHQVMVGLEDGGFHGELTA